MPEMMNKKEPRLAFVSYLSRSGSTLLCKLLDQFADIAVGIEAGFPGAITKLVPKEYEIIQDGNQLNSYLDELFEDIRFKEWKVDRKALVRKLTEHGYPLTFRDILLSCLKEYFGNTGAQVFVHKAGYYVDVLNTAEKTFPGAKHIFVVRDPRAIFNSQKNARCIYTGKSMGHSLPYFVWQYKKRIKILSDNATNNSLLCVPYESLIGDPALWIRNVLRYLDVSEEKKETGASYSDKIPENQQALHVNVRSDPNAKSLEKWRSGLLPFELKFIQARLASEMAAYGYEPIDVPPLSVKDRMAILRSGYYYMKLLAKDLLQFGDGR
ncbi:sulfotransferase [Thiovibrio sp. JS02]